MHFSLGLSGAIKHKKSAVALAFSMKEIFPDGTAFVRSSYIFTKKIK